MKPYLLKEFNNRWYVIGWVSGLNQQRTFGVDTESKQLEVTTEVFKPDPKLNIKEQFRDTIGLVYSNGKAERVVLKFTPEQANYIKTLPFHPSQKTLVDNEEEFRIELKVILNYELNQQILMQNEMVEVLEPLHLRKHIHKMLVSAASAYSK